MITVLFLLTSAAFLMSGFCFGYIVFGFKATQAKKIKPKISAEISEEYENFLRYDGTEQ